MAIATITSKVGGFVFDATVLEQHKQSVSITDHPIEGGGSIADHIIFAPDEITVKGAISEISCKGKERSKAQAFFDIERMKNSPELITVVMGLKVYDSMKIQNLYVDDLRGHSIYTIDLKRVVFASSKISNVKDSFIGGSKDDFISSDKGKSDLTKLKEKDTSDRSQPPILRGAITGQKADVTTEKAIKKQSILKGIFS